MCILRLKTKNMNITLRLNWKICILTKMCTATMMEFCHTIKIWLKKWGSFGINFGMSVWRYSQLPFRWLTGNDISGHYIYYLSPKVGSDKRHQNRSVFIRCRTMAAVCATLTLWYWHQSVFGIILTSLRSENILRAQNWQS